MNSCHFKPIHRGAYPMATRNNVCHIRNANNNDQIIRKVPAYRCPQEEAECAKTTESGTQNLPAGGARWVDSLLLRAALLDLSMRIHQQTKTYQKARVHISQVNTAIRKQWSQMERGWRKCKAKRVYGLKNEPAPSAQEKSSMEGGNKTSCIKRDKSFTLMPPSKEVQIQQLLSVLLKSFQSGFTAPAKSLPAQINWLLSHQ